MDGVAWLHGHAGLRAAWLDCPRGDWMLRFAGTVGVEQTALVLASAACAREVLALVPPNDPRPLAAIQAAESWARVPCAERLATGARRFADIEVAVGEYIGRIVDVEEGDEDDHAEGNWSRANAQADAVAASSEPLALFASDDWRARDPKRRNNAAHYAAMATLHASGRDAMEARLVAMAHHVRRVIPWDMVGVGPRGIGR